MILKIVKHPNDVLTTPTTELTRAEILSGKIQTLIEDMIDTCLAVDGLGLAANQVGVDKSLLIYRKPGYRTRFGVMINPKLKEKKDITNSKGEGCLSLPGQRFNVKRYKNITVLALDSAGEKRTTVTKSKKLAKIIQHEIDHLDGLTLAERGKRT